MGLLFLLFSELVTVFAGGYSLFALEYSIEIMRRAESAFIGDLKERILISLYHIARRFYSDGIEIGDKGNAHRP